MNLFLLTMQRVFVGFLEEIEDTKKTFRNYLCDNKLFYCQILKQVTYFQLTLAQRAVVVST